MARWLVENFNNENFITGASHCADLSSNSPNDTPRMLEVRERIFNLVRLWTGVDTSL